jgi:hypothetical protein
VRIALTFWPSEASKGEADVGKTRMAVVAAACGLAVAAGSAQTKTATSLLATIDHLVYATPDLKASIDALENAGRSPIEDPLLIPLRLADFLRTVGSVHWTISADGSSKTRRE